MMKQSFGADRVLEILYPTDDMETIVAVINQITQDSAIFNRRLSISSNFDGNILKNVKILAGATVKLEHLLGVKPLWRIILTQVGNGVITDIPSEWNDKTISIKNNGLEEVTLTIFVVRE